MKTLCDQMAVEYDSNGSRGLHVVEMNFFSDIIKKITKLVEFFK